MSTEISPRVPLDLDRSGRGRCEPPDPLFGPDGEMLYPDRDGRPMAENTLQADWIARIKGGLQLLYRDDPDVFVAADLLWYPVEGRNTRRVAPDAMVAFGRPKGYRGSYCQWEEQGIPPRVVFEIWSPGNRRRVVNYKFRFYERYGVEEYYHFDPYKVRLDGWVRDGDALRPIAEANGWVSPRLGIRFELGEDLTVFQPDGRPFLSVVETSRLLDQAERAAREANDQATRDRQAAREADARAERERQAAREADARAERMAARLRELGIDPDE